MEKLFLSRGVGEEGDFGGTAFYEFVPPVYSSSLTFKRVPFYLAYVAGLNLSILLLTQCFLL